MLDWKDRRLRVYGTLGAVVVLLVGIYFCLEKTVTIHVDQKVITVQTFKKTVSEVLKEKNIELGRKDQIKPGLETSLEDGLDIRITRAVPYTILADGRSQTGLSIPITVGEALKQAGVTLGSMDIVTPEADSVIHAGQEIKVTRVSQREMKIQTSIPFKTEYAGDGTLEKGLSKTLSRGRPGMAQETLKVTYHDGKEVRREVLKAEIIRQPVNQRVAMGTITTVSRGSLRLSFERAILAVSTAYTYTGRNTATGVRPQVGLVAVDPRVIPLGTRLYIEGYGYARAADRGSSIQGNKVDVFMEDLSQCRRWGRKTVKIYLLK